MRRPIRLIGGLLSSVVPDHTHRLHQRPGPAAFPLQVGRAEVVPQHLPRAGLEQVPGRDQVQCRVGRTEPADVQHAGQPPGGDQHVAGNQVAVVHHVGGRSPRQLPQPRPLAAQPRHVQQPLAALEAGLQPRVVIMQVAAAAGAGERPARGCRSTARPGMNSARSSANATDSPGSRRSPRRRAATSGPTTAADSPAPGSPSATGSGVGTRVRPASSGAASASASSPRPRRRPRAEREPGREPVADAEDRVDRALRGDPLTGSSRQAGNCSSTSARTSPPGRSAGRDARLAGLAGRPARGAMAAAAAAPGWTPRSR